MSGRPSNVLVENNTSPSTTGLNAYFAWVQGNDIAIVGNNVANSDGESAIRVGGASDILFAYNSITDQPKGSIAIQAGSYAYVYHNTILHGNLGVGPLGVNPEANPVINSFNCCVFDSNTIDASILVQPGAHHIVIKNNALLNAGIIINGQEGTWQARDIYILNNTVDSQGPWGYFLKINDGQAQGIVMDNNLFVDPTASAGEGNGIIVDGNNDLDSFTQIQNNIWAIPIVSNASPDGYFYDSTQPGGQGAYLTPAEWEATPLANGGYPTGDVYLNVTLGNNYDVTVGSDLPTS
jgi:hypothetical protein